MYRYLWEAVLDDGSIVHRFDRDGQEHSPDEWKVRQFHLYSLVNADADPVSLFVPRGARFRFFKEVSLGSEGPRDVTYVVGWEWPDEGRGFFVFILPDGRYELADSTRHRTRYCRNLALDPLRGYERRAKLS